VAIRHADDGASARLEYASDFLNRPLGLVEVLDRAHRVDGVEAGVLEGQLADVGNGPKTTIRRGLEGGARPGHRGFGDVDAEDASTLLARPGQDARVPGFVPEVRLEEAQTPKCREVLSQEPTFVVGVVPS